MFGPLLNFILKSFKRELVEVYPDTLVSDRKTLFSKVPEWLRTDAKTDVNLIVNHFPSTFLAVQDELEKAGIDYEIVEGKLDRNFIRDCLSRNAGTQSKKNGQKAPVILALSAQIDPKLPDDLGRNADDLPANSLPLLSVIVPEFHPYDVKSKSLIEFFRHLDVRVDIGFFIALDDVIVKKLVDYRVVLLMEEMGAKREIVSSSVFFFGHLRKRLKFHRDNRMESIESSSVEEWFEKWESISES